MNAPPIGPSHLAAYHGHLLVPQQQFKGLYAINTSLLNSTEHQYNLSALWQLIRHVAGPASSCSTHILLNGV